MVVQASCIDRLRDVLSGSRVRPLEQHVFDEVRDAAAFVAFMSGTPHQPDADGDRAYVRHGLGNEPQTIVENVTNDHALHFQAGTSRYRNLLDRKELLNFDETSMLTRDASALQGALVGRSSSTDIVQ